MLQDYKDNNRIDKMVAHLLDKCTELHGYSMDTEKRDKIGQPPVRPDRVLLHPRKPTIGIEFTELLPDASNEGGSAAMKNYYLWQNIVTNTISKLNANDEDDLASGLQMQLYIGSYLSAHDNPEILASELASLLMCNNPLHDYNLVQIESSDMVDCPHLSMVLSKLEFMIHVEKPKNRLYFESINPLWFHSAVDCAMRKKATKVDDYLNLITKNGQENGILYLVLWCRNVDPFYPQVFTEDNVTKYSTLFESSGFDAVWYLSGVYDQTTGILISWRLYPTDFTMQSHD